MPAVCAPALYDTKLATTLNSNGHLVYQAFTIVVKLDQKMRQETSTDPDQNHFIQLISRFRNGDATIEDYNLLTKRIPTPDNKQEFIDAIRILPDNLPCNQFNITELSRVNNPITALHAFNSSTKARNLEEENFNGKNI